MSKGCDDHVDERPGQTQQALLHSGESVNARCKGSSKISVEGVNVC